MVVLVILQLWLLTATMNAYLGGDEVVTWPAAVVSTLCLALNAGLLVYIRGIESGIRGRRRQHRAYQEGEEC